MIETTLPQIEEKFEELISRKDIAIILINQHIAEDIRSQIDNHNLAFPTVLEIPSKEHPYDPSKVNINIYTMILIYPGRIPYLKESKSCLERNLDEFICKVRINVTIVAASYYDMNEEQIILIIIVNLG